MALNSNFRTLTADNIEGIVEDRNYLKSSFENGTITGWTEVAVTLTSGLPTGTPTISASAASSLALSATSVTPLSGSRSLLVDVPSALTAGHGFISDEFTLDRMDLGKVLTVAFDYERVTGTYNFSGVRGSQTWMVYIYDATLGGANWLQPAGFLGMNQSSGPGRIACTFQSSVTAGQKYRVAVIASQAAAGASSIEFDNFTASRQTAPIGPVVTDWVSYTPTIGADSGTPNATATGRWRRVGDSVQIDATLTFNSTSTFSVPRISVPNAWVIDGNKVSENSPERIIGTANILDAGITPYSYAHVIYNASIPATPIAIPYQASVNATSASTAEAVRGAVITGTYPMTFNTGDKIFLNVSVPISGWSSNVQLSNDTDTRVVAFSAYDGGSVAVTNTTSLLPMGTTDIDTHAVRSGQTYVIPVSGFYRLSAKSTSRFSAGNTTFNHALFVYKNGVVQNGGDYGNADGANSAGVEFFFLSVNSVFRLNAGDVIDFRYFTNYTGVATTYLKYCSIERLSGPSVVAASESVSAIYQTSAGQSIPHNYATVIVFGTKIFDSHSAMNASTGVFTCPVSGEYQLSAAFYFSTAITATATDIQTIAYKNGVAYLGVNNAKSGTAAAPLTTSGTIRIRCNAGDTLSCAVLQANSATTAQTLLANAAFNWVAISRVGN